MLEYLLNFFQQYGQSVPSAGRQLSSAERRLLSRQATPASEAVKGLLDHEMLPKAPNKRPRATFHIKNVKGLLDDPLADSANPPIAADVARSDNDVDMLARIIIAEAGGEPTQGKVGVANVIMNRLNSKRYGFGKHDTLKKVITAENQFEGYNTDRYKKAHLKSDNWEMALNMARRALSGNLQDVTGGSLFFRNPHLRNTKARKSGQKWFDDKIKEGILENSVTIGKHSFLTQEK
jgi:spore germination cell wall hydrolase CwlJ-like protein